MKSYNKISIFENRRRLNKLYQFRELMINYYNNSRANMLSLERIEEADAKNARVEINRIIDNVHKTIKRSGINTIINWTAPAAAGGYSKDVDLILNMFIIHKFQIGPTYILDSVDRAIGVYTDDSTRAFLRTVNPFFYIGMLFEWITDIPFLFIEKFGFNRISAKTSAFGRIIKGILYLITVIASFLTIVHLLGYLDIFKNFINALIK